MTTIDDKIKKELERQTMLLEKYEKRQKGLRNKLGLSQKIQLKKNGDFYYTLDDGKYHYLGKIDGKNKIDIQRLKLDKFYDEAIARIKGNAYEMSHFLAKYRGVELKDINRSLPKTYQISLDEDYLEASSTNEDDWGEQPYLRSRSYPEQLKHRTIKGEMVRSKSEMNIANILFLRGIPYRYEEYTKVGAMVFHPDFKVLVKSTKEIKILEHFGMIGKPDYLENCVWRFKAYISEGFRPWKDIFFTYDFQDGGIDSQTIDWIITNFFV